MFFRQIFFWSLFAFSFQTVAQSSWRFDFGPGKTAKGFTKVLAEDRYTEKKGYGFLGEGVIVEVDRKGKNPLTSDFIAGDQPFYFQVRVEEGDYEVAIIFGDSQGVSDNTVKSESRRLFIENLSTKKGEFKTVRFVVNVRTPRIDANESIRIKPREDNYLNWDDKLTLEFNGRRPCVAALEIKKVSDAVAVFLAGNSTVVDQEYEPWAAWGQMIPAFFDHRVSVANYAESGESLKSFVAEKRLDKILSLMKPGDYLFVEFAHNDQKPGASYAAPFAGYQEMLRHFIAETRKKGGIPVLVTSIHRRRFDENGNIVNTLAEYPEAMRQVAREENVALIDLNEMSKKLFEALGPEESKSAFVHYRAGTFPGQEEDLADDSHFSNYGAWQLAKCVALAIRNSNLDLRKNLIAIPSYDPSRPDPLETFAIPHSPSISQFKPDGK